MNVFMFTPWWIFIWFEKCSNNSWSNSMDQNGSAAYLQMAASKQNHQILQPLSAGQPFIIENCKNVLTHDLNLNQRQHQFYTMILQWENVNWSHNILWWLIHIICPTPAPYLEEKEVTNDKFDQLCIQCEGLINWCWNKRGEEALDDFDGEILNCV